MPLDTSASTIAIELLVPGMTCAGCMSRVERRLSETAGVHGVRANLTRHMVTARVDPELADAETLVKALTDEGFAARPHDPAIHGHAETDTAGRDLLLRLGIAGFAAMNVMLLSISVWSGAEAAMRDLLHWVSALIALPAIAYCGQPFFRSAFVALSARRLNMDVPISLAVILAAGNSVAETLQGGAHAYFDAGIMLLFFLLIGRYLEHKTRAVARSAATELLAMTGRTAMRLLPDGTRRLVPVDRLEPGMQLEIAAGERIPADGIIADGRTELDRALVTGESRPEPAAESDAVHAGMVNLTGAIRVEVTAIGAHTLLAEIARMVDAAERGRGRYDRIADRAARIYAPAVHILAAGAFVGWFVLGGDARLAVQIAVAVLIVTCPCALALAVPTVHTVASGRLFRQGIFLKDGAELERLAEVDMVVFDKTGTLTDGKPRLLQAPPNTSNAWPLAAALAARSRHPLSQAIFAEAAHRGIEPAILDDIQEYPGLGVSGIWKGDPVRLGRATWASGGAGDGGVMLSMPDERTASFTFTETLRPGAVATCEALGAMGLDLAILSGDHAPAVTRIADMLGIPTAHAEMLPAGKLAWLEARRAEGRRVLMVGDGLNDSPALAAAHASMSPTSAMDVAKTAAGLVFTSNDLGAVATALGVARMARRRTLQSFGTALGYNALAIPLAMAGFVTPLFAALSMSASSILVVLNSLRQGSRNRP